LTQDYPRQELKKVTKAGTNPDAVTLTYMLSDELLKAIEEDTNIKPKSNIVEFTKKYNNNPSWLKYIDIDTKSFLNAQFKKLGIKNAKLVESLLSVKNQTEFNKVIATIQNNGLDAEDVPALQELLKYYKNSWEWANPLSQYVMENHVKANLPKFMYYDEYYELEAQISIQKLNTNSSQTNSLKTAKALLELADIDLSNLTQSNNFEKFITELEATQLTITKELFKYWSANKNLQIKFEIQPVMSPHNSNTITDRILHIRVANTNRGVSLPLDKRSKGFNWFFSFLVWFLKIQEDQDSSYILLLDEPGLNLHATAQYDLLRFINDLAKDYQIIYTTHSPFMIESDKLQKVRTVVEKEDGTHISNSVQEKDPNTLFPLQAALGYTIAQNLFVSKNNLIVEGIADLTYLEIMSNIMQENKKECLRNDITIVPVGGADKVPTFISLLRGNNAIGLRPTA
jgi:predicted ATP-binding protein involved in virulence